MVLISISTARPPCRGHRHRDLSPARSAPPSRLPVVLNSWAPSSRPAPVIPQRRYPSAQEQHRCAGQQAWSGPRLTMGLDGPQTPANRFSVRNPTSDTTRTARRLLRPSPRPPRCASNQLRRDLANSWWVRPLGSWGWHGLCWRRLAARLALPVAGCMRTLGVTARDHGRMRLPSRRAGRSVLRSRPA